MPKLTKPTPTGKRFLAALAVVPVAGLMLLGGTVSTQAEAQNFWNCFGLMITDPALHVKQCGPGHFPPYDLSSEISAATPMETTPTGEEG